MNKSLLLVATALMSFCTPATAAIITTTVNGVLTQSATSGDIPSNAFGLGPDYAGTAFNVVFTFDDTTVGADRSDNGIVASLGGVGPLACTGCSGAPGYSVLTINGVTRRVGNEYSAVLRKELSSNPRGFYSAETNGFPQGSPSRSSEGVSIQFLGDDIFPITDLTKAFSRTAQDGDEGYFNYSYFIEGVPSSNLFLSGTISDINVSVTSAVPEPATWAMLILGFGLIGGSMRRRRSTSAKPAAITLQRV